jgi:hypothetical protein
MKREIEDDEPAIGYTWAEVDGTYYLRNPSGEFRTVSDDAMRFLELLADGEVRADELDGGASRLFETLSDERYLRTGDPVVKLVQPPEIRLWPRVLLFLALLGVAAAASVVEAAALGSSTSLFAHLSGLLTPLNVVAFAVLIVFQLAIHEYGHHLAARDDIETSYEFGTINWFVPAVLTNTDGAWVLPRNNRLWISLAGPVADLVGVVAIAIVHYLVLPGYPLLGAFVLLRTYQIVYGLLPVYHGDGYWLLVDTFDLGNFRERGLRHVRNRTVSKAAAYVVVTYGLGVMTFAAILAWATLAFGLEGTAVALLVVGVALFDRTHVERLKCVLSDRTSDRDAAATSESGRE